MFRSGKLGNNRDNTELIFTQVFGEKLVTLSCCVTNFAMIRCLGVFSFFPSSFARYSHIFDIVDRSFHQHSCEDFGGFLSLLQFYGMF